MTRFSQQLPPFPCMNGIWIAFAAKTIGSKSRTIHTPPGQSHARRKKSTYTKGTTYYHNVVLSKILYYPNDTKYMFTHSITPLEYPFVGPCQPLMQFHVPVLVTTRWRQSTFLYP